MVKNLLKKVFGDPGTKTLKKYESMVPQINDLEPEMEKLSDKELKAKTGEFKNRVEKGESLDDLLPEAFAVVREASKRVLGMRHFDVQLIGGMTLHEGKVAEMRTGEGKTLAATLAVYLNALSGKGAHVVTVNDYLAQRDAGWMGQIYHFLGMSTGIIISQTISFVYDPEFTNEEHDDERLSHLKPAERTEAYKADILYGTNNEFGFDYLRDNTTGDPSRLVQRELNFAIVDEVDSILIDEARTPLIMSAPSATSKDKYSKFAKIAKSLSTDQYTIDEKTKSVSLTEKGVEEVEQRLNIENLYDPDQIHIIYHLEQALKAEKAYIRDKDYVVRGGEVIIVDEFTGRLMQGRRYSEGLHQAIEAKEGVEVQQESMTLATTTFQNYFRLYDKLAGMTGTAETEAEEFYTIYELDVVVIPTNQPIARNDMGDQIYKTEAGKFRAIGRDVKERHKKGQPVLIGTVSIEKNEILSQVLDQYDIPHEVLNAKNNEREAAIVSNAGQKGSVTIATNIAGRGTDIVLGEGVVELGGLHVIGSERHESRRIDNQLRGRAGRQGDPGSSQFYVSLEDDLMRIFGGERISGLMETVGFDEDTPIENKFISRAIESSQKKVESHNFDIRKNVVQYDDVMNRHRESIYSKRRKALNSENLRPEIEEMFEKEIEMLVDSHAGEDNFDAEKVVEIFHNLVPFNKSDDKKLIKLDPEEMKKRLMKHVDHIYHHREEDFGKETMRNIERAVYLQNLDSQWVEHLENMDHLKSSVRYKQNSLVEYKNQGFQMYQALLSSIRYEIVNTIFKVVPSDRVQSKAVDTELTKAAKQASTNASKDESSNKSQTVRRSKRKIGRNEPCPCGSGLKYKKCGLIDAPEHKG